MTKTFAKLEGLLLLIILSLMTWLLIGDFQVRLANVFADDGPVVYAYLMQNPHRFDGDILATYGYSNCIGTIQNWLPALLLRAVGLSPSIPVWIFICLQNVLLGFAILKFVQLVTKSREIAWLAIFFSLAATPWRWNLANFSTAMQYPYAGHLVLPFLILAAAWILEGRLFLGLLVLTLSGLIHPSLTLYAVLILGLFWSSQYLFQDRRKLAVRLMALGVVAAVCVAPALLLQPPFERMPAADLIHGLRQNYHIFPWNFPSVWASAVLPFAGFSAVTVLALRHFHDFDRRFRTFWLSTLSASIILALSQLLGTWAGVPRVAQVIGLRATIPLVIFSLPIVLFYLMEKLKNVTFYARWAAILILLLAGFWSVGLFWGPIAALLFSELSEGYLGLVKFQPSPALARALRWLSGLTLIGWAVFALLPVMYLLAGIQSLQGLSIPGLMIPGLALSAHQYPYLGGILVIGASLAAICGRDWSQARKLSRRLLGSIRIAPSNSRMGQYSLSAIVLIVILAGLTLYKSKRIGDETNFPALRSNYQAQVWARDHTPEDARFIVYRMPWRSTSLRRVINPAVTVSYVYTGNLRARQFDDEYLAFYGLDNALQTMSYTERDAAESAAYLGLNEAGVARLAHQFGGDYIVRPADAPLKLPEAYRNDQLVIYKLTTSQ
jgi:hypothetical protein